MRPQHIEDIYRLSPIQEGMLFHCLYAPESDLYFRQHVCALKGDISIEAFSKAWEQVVSRHAILRSSFHWQDLDQPLQVVRRQVNLPFKDYDWRALPATDQQERLKALIDSERKTAFDLAAAPLMRLALVRVSDDASHFIWSYHHLLMDGWSKFLLLKELFAFYEAFSEGKALQLPEPRPFREYIAWLQRQNVSDAETFWRRMLKGFTEPTGIGCDEPRAAHLEAEDRFAQRHIQLSDSATTRLQSLARANRITLGTLLQGAWALLLSHYSRTEDLVFGVTVSGRPAEVAGIETMVGVFINTLPVRVRVSPDERLLDWLRRLQSQQAQMHQYEHSPLASVQKWSDAPRGKPLFESIFVFGNYPIDASVKEQKGKLKVANPYFYEKSNYRLALSASPGPALAPQLHYDRSRFSEARINQMLTDIETILRTFIERPDEKLSAYLSLLGEARKREALSRRQLERAAPKGFAGLKPKPIKLSEKRLVRTHYLGDGPQSPLVVQPNVDGVNLISWVKGNLSFIESELSKCGAILFREFNVESVPLFEQFACAISPDLLEYYERTVQRTEVGNRIYTASEYPPDHPIPLHNEYSFSQAWPMKLWFFCVRPADRGGETVIADSRRVFNLINPRVREKFMEKKVMYVRNFGDGLDLTWQDAFQTGDRREVEQYFLAEDIEFEWKDNDRLRTRQIRRAAIGHPRTGEMLWFNQANLFHVSSLDASPRESLLAMFKEEDLPRHAFYGDGSVIEPEALDEIRGAYEKTAMTLALNRGDVLMLDNMLVAHGRTSFVGPRKIVVAMAEKAECAKLSSAERGYQNG